MEVSENWDTLIHRDDWGQIFDQVYKDNKHILRIRAFDVLAEWYYSGGNFNSGMFFGMI